MTRRTVQAGFTLIELLVAILISVALIVGMLNLFDLSNRISLEQTEIAEMQQSHRVAQYDIVRLARETARGMVPVDAPDNPTPLTIPNGLAVAVRNNVGPDENLITAGGGMGPVLVDGSDVLTLRGIFSNPIYLVDYGNPNAVNITGDPPSDGSIVIDGIYQGTVQQDLQKLLDLAGGVAAQPEALFVVGPRSDASFSIVELTGVAGDANQVTISFDINGGARTGEYQTLAPWPAAGMRNIAYVGVLEEYHYFVEEQFRDPTNPVELMPRLARARLYPGTTTPHPSNPTMNTPIADNVFDLQLAMGFDTIVPLDGQVTENNPPDAADEWLYNAPGDEATEGDTTMWVRADIDGDGDLDRKPLYYLRINTLIHTDRKFRLHFSDQLAGGLTPVEDRQLWTGAGNPDDPEQLRYRRRWLQSTVDFRNLF